VFQSLKDFGEPVQAFQRDKGIQTTGGGRTIGGTIGSVQDYINKRRTQRGSEQSSPPMKMTIIKPKKQKQRKEIPKHKKRGIKISDEAFEKYIKHKKRQNKEWEEEERKLMEE